MLIVLSPSKTLDETSPLPKLEATQPELLGRAGELVKVLRNYSSAKISKLMDISDKLSELNFYRFQNYSIPFTPKNARPALFMFKGDVYEPMGVMEYGKKELAYAQGHVRILSGLYGVLRPLDLMQPYRLEMGTRLPVGKAKDLYGFWGDEVSEALNGAMAGMKKPVLINLASEEYFKAVRPKVLRAPVIDIVFKEKQKDKLKIIGLFAKKARGMMTDFAIREQVNTPEKLKEFSGGGYCFQPKLSAEDSWVFVR